MKLENRFTVPVPVDEAWRVLLDVERVAPCMPGATLTSRDGDDFEGTVKVKVGPINLTYGGKASFVSKDEATHVAVIDGSGKETRGTGTAKALITCRLIDKGDSTDVEVDTDLNVTGKPAQFGRGVLADVSGKLVDQFAACLADELQSGAGAPEPVFAAVAAELGSPEGVPPPPAAPVPPRRSAEAIDLLGTAGAPVLKRLGPLLAGLAVLLLVARRLRR
jgi:carbon monoxide dehydrogenase subunit G